MENVIPALLANLWEHVRDALPFLVLVGSFTLAWLERRRASLTSARIANHRWSKV
jgi:hypothetical protein